MPAEDVRLERL